MKKQTEKSHLQAGLTLVELMVALAIGTLLLLGVGVLFTQNKQSYRQNEDLARMQEEARFAIDELSRDISMVGFVAEIPDPSGIQTTPFETMLGSTVSCGAAGAPRNWFYDFSESLLEASLAVSNNVLNGTAANQLFSCIPAGEFEPGTDIIGIKRTSGSPSGWGNLPNRVDRATPGNRIYFRESGAEARLLDDAGRAADATAALAPFQDWEYTPRIYFIRNFSVTPLDGIPSLCRVRLVNDGTGGTPPEHVQECIAQGVEDLQLLYGIDTTADGSANTFLSNPTGEDLSNLVSVRIYLLMRTVNQDMGYEDTRTYVVGDKAPYTPADRFHRRIYSSTVMVRNLRPLQPFN